MKIKEVTDKKTWEEFVQAFRPNNFLASWSWGDFHTKMGEKVFRLGLFDSNERLVGACLIIKVEAKRGNFLLSPSGPLLQNHESKNLKFFIDEIKKIASSERANFIRLRPLVERSKWEKDFKKEDFISSPTYVHAQVSWILDIAKTEEELLLEMRKTTRYLIRDAIKKGVKVKEKNSDEGLDVLEKLQRETVKRHNFTPFSEKYLRSEFEVFRAEKNVKVLVADYKGEVLAAALVVYYGDSGFYHHGASKKTKIPVTYALQWEAIRKAKELGKKYYNFWGIAPNDSPSHPWSGLTYFKQGFGGTKVEYLWPQDFPLSVFYPVTALFERIRIKLRGLG